VRPISTTRFSDRGATRLVDRPLRFTTSLFGTRAHHRTGIGFSSKPTLPYGLLKLGSIPSKHRNGPTKAINEVGSHRQCCLPIGGYTCPPGQPDGVPS
jgi:hypothetical protein